MNRRTFIAGAVATAVALHADPSHAITINNPSPRRHGPVALIGDSLSGGNIPALRRMLNENSVGPYRLDILSGRSMTRSARKRSGMHAIQTMRVAGFDPGAWVVALGGNDLSDFRYDRRDPVVEMSKVLDVIGDAEVAWPTIARRDKKWQPVAQEFNDALHHVATLYPRLHVIEWADLLNQHNPKWYRDNAHLRGAGVVARNQMTVDAMILVTS